MSSLRILGLMTGTSCDGLDAVCIAARGHNWEVLWRDSRPYPAPLRRRVLQVQEPGRLVTLRDLLVLDRDLGTWLGREARALSGRARRAPPHVVASHGQTIAHHPDSGVTFQAGNPSAIASAARRTVVSRFRDGDLASGGQGAPLVPLFHVLLARKHGFLEPGAAIHNIGGISNLTYLGAGGKIVAFDTGPGNAWIDAAASEATRGKRLYDRDGALARSGRADERAVAAILRNRYFSKLPPKSTGRDDFPYSMLKKATRARGADLVATATEITARSIADAYARCLVSRGSPVRTISFCGGGALNGWLMERTARLLRPLGIRARTLDSDGMDSRYVEAEAFALFGFLSLAGAPLGGRWTGSRGFGPPGWITPGENWPEVLSLLRKVL
jgi:anhydro-N-acetylmuramic acid kinase